MDKQSPAWSDPIVRIYVPICGIGRSGKADVGKKERKNIVKRRIKSFPRFKLSYMTHERQKLSRLQLPMS
jgi:hypothetical protein